jgi:hypothetical protein
VTFERGNETVELAGDTQVQIFDRTGRKFTTVKQYFGTVAVEADVRQVQHFAVQTPHLAAVVKGTRFTVSSGKRGAKVEVDRGRVAVEDRDTHQSTTVVAGQSVATSTGAPLEVSGRGELPAIRGADGKVVTAGTEETLSPKQAAAVAREAALAAGATAKEAEKAAKEAAKDAKEAAKEEAKESKEAAKDAKEAAKDARQESKEAAKEAKEEAKESKKDSGGSSDSGSADSSNASGNSGGDSSTSGNSDSGGASESDSSGKGKKDKD